MAEEVRAPSESKQRSVMKHDQSQPVVEVENSRTIQGQTSSGGECGKNGEGEQTRGIVLAEVKFQCRLAWPMIIANLLAYSYIIISVMFVGHLGELELSSVSIANSFASVSGFSFMIGLATAMETLCGQAYGAKQYYQLGVYLQTAIMVTCSFCIPVIVVWLNMEKILVAIGQDPQISHMAASYLHYLIPGLLSSAFSTPTTRFLQTQGLVLPIMVNALISASLHPFICYTLIHLLGFGFHGGAMATCASFTLLMLLNLGYALCSGKCRKCWGGLALREAFGSIGMYLTLAIPSVVMICFEFWSFELLVLSSGLLPNPSLELSLLTISLNSVNFSDMIPLGICVAASIRVSNELGANRPDAAMLAMRVALGLGILNGCVVSSILILLRGIWGHAFTDVEEVVDYVAQVTPFLAILIFMDSVAAVLSGVVRGSGRQALGAYINFTAYYLVGIPICLTLGFKFHFNGKGLVMGLVFAIFVQMTLLIVLNTTTNWQNMAKQAQGRVNKAPPEHEPLLPSHSTSEPISE